MIPIGETKDGRADMTNFELDLFDVKFARKDDSEEYCKKSCNIPPACLPVTILALLLMLVFVVPIFNEDPGIGSDGAGNSIKKYERTGICTDQCGIEIVESIPTGMSLSPRFMSTYDSWNWLMNNAEKSLDLSALYWSLRDNHNYSTSWQGRSAFARLIELGKSGIKLRISQNAPGNGLDVTDSEYLQKQGLAEVRTLNFTELFGSGVLHTKFWISDRNHFYLGSANMDWKSLSEVKELGVLVKNCSCLAWELSKIFTIYWRVGTEHAVPSHDLSAILYCIERAKNFVRISVMDYLPAMIYLGRNNSYWPAIDDAIREAAFRGIRVEMMVSQWQHTKKEMIYYLRSLMQINEALPFYGTGKGSKRRGSITIKFFKVPSGAEKIPFTRVNHNKYMVTDATAYIGTSNWTGDYFNNTAGVGLVIEKIGEKNTVIDQLNSIFERDWNSQYSYPVK